MLDVVVFSSDRWKSVLMTGVTDQIRRAIENVVRNAIRYTKVNSQVEITMCRQRALPAPTGPNPSA